jgi:glutaredoxin
MNIKFTIAKNIMRQTRFGKHIDDVYVVLGFIIAIVACVLAIIGAIDYYKKHKKTFSNVNTVQFYSLATCGHCKEFQKTWDELTKNNKLSGVTFEKIEATEQPQRVQNEGIMFFPTIKINGIEYNGPRTTEAITESILAAIVPQN